MIKSYFTKFHLHGDICLTVANIIGLVTILMGGSVLFGWAYGIPYLKTVLPSYVSMKPVVALAFIMSGIMIVAMALDMRRFSPHGELMVSAMAMSLLLLDLSVVFDALTPGFGFLNELPHDEQPLHTVRPGIPSVASIAAFALISLGGFAFVFNTHRWRYRLRLCGYTTLLIGGAALLGYASGVEYLYYYWEGKTTAMALHTAAFFIAIGHSMVLIATSGRRRHNMLIKLQPLEKTLNLL